MNRRNRQTVDSSALRAMEAKIDQLPLLPQVLVKLLQLSQESPDYFDQVEKLAEEDPAFAVRVVALANSASSAPAVPITSIKTAVTRMGSATIGDLVASLAVQRVFMPREPSQVRLWQHSISAAVATQRVAGLIPSLELEPGQAYLAGLLHDVGRFVMFEHAAPALLKVDESNWHTPEELIAADVEIYKFTHSELGFLACRHWGLPDDIAEMIRHHHTPIDGPVVAGTWVALTLCVQIADRLCLAIVERPRDEDASAEQIEKRILEHCLTTDQERRLLSPSAVQTAIPLIRRDSERLLAGLGFAP